MVVTEPVALVHLVMPLQEVLEVVVKELVIILHQLEDLEILLL